MNELVLVKKSGIQGKGVFAKRDIKKGETVINWSTCSKILNKKEVEKLSENKKKLVSYKGKDQYVLFRSPGRYVNHSCSANTQAIDGKDVAIKRIKKGEEITADYFAEKVPGLKFKCTCGSKNCKGMLNNAFEG